MGITASGPATIEKSLRLSLADAFLYSLMVGIGETYLPAFALSVGLGEIFAGILSSLPLVSGAVLQLLTPRGLDRVGSHKAWVVLTVMIQACAFLPLIYFSFGQTPHFWTLFLILTLYWGAGFASGPSWNFWMGHLVSSEISQRYFSLRAQISQVGILIGLILGGVALHNKVTILSFSSVFGGLFFVAFLCRLGSSFLLSRQLFRFEWQGERPKMLGVRASWRVFWGSPEKRGFFLALVPYMMAVYVSSPFVTPYFLAQLQLDYGAYMIAIAALMIGKIVTLTWVSRRTDDIGGRRLFIFGALAVAPGPALWWLSTSYGFVLALQFVSGMAWACLEVGLALIFVRDLAPEEKVPVLTIYNLLNAAAIVVGTLLGGWLLSLLGEHFRGYWLLFALGGAMRILFAYPLWRRVRVWLQATPSTRGPFPAVS